MNTLSKTEFHRILDLLRKDYGDVYFIKSTTFRWNPDKRVVFFSTKAEHPIWSLFHEVGHMHLAHSTYAADISLLKMEVEAWRQAKKLGEAYGHPLDEEYIQECIDSYRDWLYRRSMCPECKQTGVEKNAGTYICPNCCMEWNVSRNRLCRVYRKAKSPVRLQSSFK